MNCLRDNRKKLNGGGGSAILEFWLSQKVPTCKTASVVMRFRNLGQQLHGSGKIRLVKKVSFGKSEKWSEAANVYI